MRQWLWERRGLLILGALIVATWLPRAGALDRFVTSDERKWLARSGNFYQALTHGDFRNTFQREHPGVTVMWAGMAGFLWRYPAYAREAPGQFGWEDEEIEPFLRAHGHEPLELLAAGRVFMVLGITIVLAAAFAAAARLLGRPAALLGFLLIAFDPLHVALSRLLHLDALVSSLMLLSLLAFLNYRYRGRRRADLVVSAVAAGLAWLTKSPALFLIPFVGLLVMPDLLRAWRAGALWCAIRPLAVWFVVGAGVFVVLWPAMWVDPAGSLARVFGEAEEYAIEGHLNPLYFDGRVVNGDPGLHFYPVAYLWRATPAVLGGLALAGVAFASARARAVRGERLAVAGALALFALLFTVFISAGAKKFDRYLLPVFAPLDLIAGMGWAAAAAWLARRSPPRWAQIPAAALPALAVAAQILGTVPTYPYYLSYYNPLLGGSARAPQVMQIGWGEGLDQAARYLNGKPGVEQLRVVSSSGSFTYFFKGQIVEIGSSANVTNVLRWLSADYVALYVNEWQRQEPSPQLLKFFATLTPERVIEIDGLEYVRIYDLRDVLLPDFLALGRPRYADWDGAIRLVGYQLPERPLEPGERFQMTFYLQNLAPLDRNLNVLVRVVGADGQELLRDEGWPWGSPTSSWKRREVWPDGHEMAVPASAAPGYYRVELGFYDPETLERLPAADARTRAPVGESFVVDYLEIGNLPRAQAPLLPAAEFGQRISLQGAALSVDDEPDRSGSTLLAHPGALLRLQLYWQALGAVDRDFTVFVHLVGPDGGLVAQRDQQPLQGFVPTSLWRRGRTIVDDYELMIPADAPAGSYELRAGLYDPATGQRLPVSRDGRAAGDYVVLAEIGVE